MNSYLSAHLSQHSKDRSYIFTNNCLYFYFRQQTRHIFTYNCLCCTSCNEKCYIVISISLHFSRSGQMLYINLYLSVFIPTPTKIRVYIFTDLKIFRNNWNRRTDFNLTRSLLSLLCTNYLVESIHPFIFPTPMG